MSAYDELTVADDDIVRMEDSVLTEKAQESCGYMEGGGLAAETPDARSYTADRLRPHPPSSERDNDPQSASGGERGWLRRLPTETQEILSGEELTRGKPSIADGESMRTLSSLFAYAFPDDDRHQGLLPESARGSSRSGGGGGGTRSRCSGVVGTDGSSPQNPSSLPPLLPGGGADATMEKKSPLVGITVRRPPSPQFSFMAENGPSDASISPPTFPMHRTPEVGKQREVQGTSCVMGIDGWTDGASQREEWSAQSKRPSVLCFRDDPEIPAASTPVDEAGPLSGDAGQMSGEEVRILALSRKRRHPEGREATSPRDSRRPPSPGCHRASSTSEDGTCFGSMRRRGERRNGWSGETVGYTSPSVRDQTAAAGASRLQVDAVSCGERGQMMPRHVEASGASEARAGDSARCEAETSNRDTRGVETPATVAGGGEISSDKGDRRRDDSDARVALVYNQDVLGGEGATEASVGEMEPQTVAGILGKLRCDENHTVIREGLSSHTLRV